MAAILVAWVALGVACGEGGEAVKKASRKVADEAKVLEENVERSARVAEETYRTEREEDVGRVQAAGDAYEAVREIPLEKDAEEKESEKKESEKKESE